MEKESKREKAIVGALLGTMVGDALGLPYEGVSCRRAKRLLGTPDQHRLFFGQGMISDDTEQSWMVACALMAAGNDVTCFQRHFSWSLRYWLLGLPAGIGFATLRAIIRLWLGWPVDKAGVFSAGNGPAMRVAVLGAALAEGRELRQFVQAATRLTHTDPKAELGALAIALAAQMGAEGKVTDTKLGGTLGGYYQQRLQQLLADEPEAATWLTQVSQVVRSVEAGEPTTDFAITLGQAEGIGGYVYHTVPIALHLWLSYPQDYQQAVGTAISLGGDTDTVAAIVGGMVGANTGEAGIPVAWLKGVVDWPLSTSRLRQDGCRLAQARQTGEACRVKRLPLPWVWLRNVFFLGVVLFHGFRRALPPY